MVIDEYLRYNVMNNNRRLNRIDINFEGYHKIIPSSCIRNEIRRKFWHMNEPLEELEPDSICAPLTKEQIAHYFTPRQLVDRKHLYNNIDFYDNVLPGQRGFGRNVDRLSNQLINYYHDTFRAQANETMKKIEAIHEKIDAQDIETLKRNCMVPISQQRKR